MNRSPTNGGWNGKGKTARMVYPRGPLFIVEKRGPVTGLDPNPKYHHTAQELEQLKCYRPLDFSEPQPPAEWVHGVTEDGYVNYYFARSGNKERSASMEEIHKWFNDQGWFIRRKAW